MLVIHQIGVSRDTNTCRCVCAEACGFELLSTSVGFGVGDSVGLCDTRRILERNYFVQLHAMYRELKVINLVGVR